jgi:hypothetical protein
LTNKQSEKFWSNVESYRETGNDKFLDRARVIGRRLGITIDKKRLDVEHAEFKKAMEVINA